MPDTRHLGPLLIPEQTAPGTPASGYGTVYFKTDGLAYYKNDAGTEYSLGVLMAQITHGTTASTARPTGHGVVLWIGSVRPTNAVAGDLLQWVPTVTTMTLPSLWRRGSQGANYWNLIGGGQIGQGNLLGDPSFEISASGLGYNGYLNCTPAYTNAQARTGAQSYGVTKNGTPANMAFGSNNSTAVGGGCVACVEGDQFVASAWARSAVTGRQFGVYIQFIVNLNDFGATENWTSDQPTDTTTGWTYHQSAGICPAGCNYARVQYQWVSCAASEVHYIDDARFERGLIPSDPSPTVLEATGTPADASVARGQAWFFLDTTTGLPKIKAKIKDAADTTFALDVAGSDGLAMVNHGTAGASTARPATSTNMQQVLWTGSTYPANSASGDLWLYRPVGTEAFGEHSLWMRAVAPGATSSWVHVGGGPPGQGNLEGDPGQEISATPFAWTTFGTGASIAYSTDTARTGDQSMKVTKTASPANMICYKQNSVLIAVAAGDPISASMWTKPGSTARQSWIELQWLDGAFASVASYAGRPSTQVSGAWVQVMAKGIAPAAGFVRIVYTWGSVGANEVHYFDDLRTEKGLTQTGPDSPLQLLAVDAPADATLQNGAAGIYLDPTTGAPRLMARIKDAAGTASTVNFGVSSDFDAELMYWMGDI